MRAIRIIMGLIPALPFFYLTYLLTNLLMAFVFEMTRVGEMYLETRNVEVFKGFRMGLDSAFVMAEGYQLIYIFIGLVFLYSYIRWYIQYIMTPKKVSRKQEIKRRLDEIQGIDKVSVGTKEELTEEPKYRAVEAIRVEEDVESKEMMREILEAVKKPTGAKVSESKDVIVERVDEIDLDKALGEKEEKDSLEKFKEEFQFSSMMTDKKISEVVGTPEQDKEEEIKFELLDRK